MRIRSPSGEPTIALPGSTIAPNAAPAAGTYRVSVADRGAENGVGGTSGSFLGDASLVGL